MQQKFEAQSKGIFVKNQFFILFYFNTCINTLTVYDKNFYILKRISNKMKIFPFQQIMVSLSFQEKKKIG